jgi:ribosomal protein S17E
MDKMKNKDIKKLAKRIIGRYFPEGKTKTETKQTNLSEDFDENKATASFDAFLQSGHMDALIFKNKDEHNN